MKRPDLHNIPCSVVDAGPSSGAWLFCSRCRARMVVAFGYNALHVTRDTFVQSALDQGWTAAPSYLCYACRPKPSECEVAHIRDILIRLELSSNDGADVGEAEELFRGLEKRYGSKFMQIYMKDFSLE